MDFDSTQRNIKYLFHFLLLINEIIRDYIKKHLKYILTKHFWFEVSKSVKRKQSCKFVCL